MLFGIYVPGVRDVIGLVPLGFLDWGKIVLCVIAHITLVEIVKLELRIRAKIMRMEGRRFFAEV